MSWGTRVALLYTGFAAMILFMVYKASMQNVDLVAPDYYEKELKYQQQIDGMNNMSEYPQQIKIEQQNKTIEISFPAEMGSISGTVLLFKPDNAKADFILPIEINSEGVQSISTAKLSKGQYLIKLDWQWGNKNYFKESRLVVH